MGGRWWVTGLVQDLLQGLVQDLAQALVAFVLRGDTIQNNGGCVCAWVVGGTGRWVVGGGGGPSTGPTTGPTTGPSPGPSRLCFAGRPDQNNSEGCVCAWVVGGRLWVVGRWVVGRWVVGGGWWSRVQDLLRDLLQDLVHGPSPALVRVQDLLQDRLQDLVQDLVHTLVQDLLQDLVQDLVQDPVFVLWGDPNTSRRMCVCICGDGVEEWWCAAGDAGVCLCCL